MKISKSLEYLFCGVLLFSATATSIKAGDPPVVAPIPPISVPTYYVQTYVHPNYIPPNYLTPTYAPMPAAAYPYQPQQAQTIQLQYQLQSTIIQEQRQEIENLKSTNAILQQEIQDLKSELASNGGHHP